MSGITLGNVTIDRDRFEVWVDVRRVDLTFVEFELLCHLARNADKVVARPKLVQAIWNEPPRGPDRKLTVHMSRLRKKMRGSRPWHIEGYGTQRGVLQEWQGQEFWIEFLPKLWFLIVVNDEDAEAVIDAICQGAFTGEPGDGKIFVTEVRDVVRVRTRERGAAALTGGTPVMPQS